MDFRDTRLNSGLLFDGAAVELGLIPVEHTPLIQPAHDYVPRRSAAAARAAALATSFFFVPVVDAAPATPEQWAPSYPDQVRPRARAPDSVLAAPVGHDRLGIDSLAWLATYPSSIARAKPQQPDAMVAPVGHDRHGVDSLAWLPQAPVSIARAPRAVQSDSAAPSIDTSHPLAWAPTAPDWFPRARITDCFTADPIDSTPRAPAPDLSWAPTYPDFARGHRPLTWFWNPDRIEVPTFTADVFEATVFISATINRPVFVSSTVTDEVLISATINRDVER